MEGIKLLSAGSHSPAAVGSSAPAGWGSTSY